MIDRLNSEYNDCLSTIKSTSLDDLNNEFMIESNLMIFDFDKIKEKYSSKFKLIKTPSSNDALFYNNEEDFYFIEFKNGRISQFENGKIKFKFLESILIFLDIIKMDLDFSRKHVKYILVYNLDANISNNNFNDENKISEVNFSVDFRIKIGQALMKRAGKELVRFDLARYMNIYVKEVHTYDIEEFKINFLEKYDSDFSIA